MGGGAACLPTRARPAMVVAFGQPIYPPWSIFPWWFSFDAYAAVYASTYGVDEPVSELIPAMLTAFLESDRSFTRPRELSAKRQN